MSHMASNEIYMQNAQEQTYLISRLYEGKQMQMKVLLGIQHVQVLPHLCPQVLS